KIFEKLFYEDKKLNDSLLTSSKFKSNKIIYSLHSQLYNFYDSLYSPKTVIKMLNKEKPIFIVKSDKDNYILLQRFDKRKSASLKTAINEAENILQKREKKSMIVTNLYTYPIDWLIQKIPI